MKFSLHVTVRMILKKHRWQALVDNNNYDNNNHNDNGDNIYPLKHHHHATVCKPTMKLHHGRSQRCLPGLVKNLAFIPPPKKIWPTVPLLWFHFTGAESICYF